MYLVGFTKNTKKGSEGLYEGFKTKNAALHFCVMLSTCANIKNDSIKLFNLDTDILNSCEVVIDDFQNK